MQVSTSVPCHHDNLKGCIHQINVRDSWARSNTCWKCGGLGHFQKDCKVTLNPQCGNRDDKILADTNPAISQRSHTLTISTSITDLTFMTILKELLSLAIGNRKAFCPKSQTTPKTSIQPTTSGVSLTVTPIVTSLTSTSSPPTPFLPTPFATSSGSTVYPGRGPPQTRHQEAVYQGAMCKANRPVTSQAVVQLFDMPDVVSEELQCKESIEEARSVEKVHKIVKEFQESPHWLVKCYQPEVYFASKIEDKNKGEFVEVITLSLTRGAAFPVTIAGVSCNTLIDTGATRRCIINLCYHRC